MFATAQKVGQQREQTTRPHGSRDQMDEQAVGRHVM
jgi:hypothetical protein